MPYPTPSTKEAYEAAWNEIYARQPADIKKLIKKAQDDPSFASRETIQFIKDVIRKAEYEPSEEEWIEIKKKEKLDKAAKK